MFIGLKWRAVLVLGVTVGVAASLLTVALCHYLGVARLSLMLALLIP